MKILGIDMGIASIGWGLVEVAENNRNNNKIIDSSVRIFTKAEHPKTGSSLALPRREARGKRRTLRRKANRMKQLKFLFLSNFAFKKEDLFEKGNFGSGTIYKEKKKIDVWQLRKEAIERKLEKSELVRILSHIAKRRGYKSNSKTESDNETGKVIKALKENEQKMQEKNCLTIGEYLYKKMLDEKKEKTQQVKIRNSHGDYKQCVTRELLLKEIEIIFEKQTELGNSFSEQLKKKYIDIAFHQRPFDNGNTEGMVGNCIFEKEEKRAPKQCYSAEIFVCLTKIINNTILIENKSPTELPLYQKYKMEDILQIFHEQKKVTYSTLRKKLKIAENFKFKIINYSKNFESDKKLPSYEKFQEQETWLTNEQIEKITFIPNKGKNKGIPQFNTWIKTYADIRKNLSLKEKYPFQSIVEKDYINFSKKIEDVEVYTLKGYHEIKSKFKDNLALFEKLFSNKNLFNEIGKILTYYKDIDQSTEKLKNSLTHPNSFFSSQEQAIIIDCLNNITFKAFNNLSLKAIDKILPYMKKGIRYDEAVKEAGYEHHSKDINSKNKKKFIRPLTKEENYQLTNPVVKRAFAQFRKVVNAIIRKHGQFDSMHIELSRELKNSRKNFQES